MATIDCPGLVQLLLKCRLPRWAYSSGRHEEVQACIGAAVESASSLEEYRSSLLAVRQYLEHIEKAGAELRTSCAQDLKQIFDILHKGGRFSVEVTPAKGYWNDTKVESPFGPFPPTHYSHYVVEVEQQVLIKALFDDPRERAGTEAV